MKKEIILTIGFLVFIVYISYSLTMSAKYECEVCILYNDKEVCQKVTGMEEKETIIMGISTACGGAADGRTENIDCSNTPPTKVICKEL